MSRFVRPMASSSLAGSRRDAAFLASLDRELGGTTWIAETWDRVYRWLLRQGDKPDSILG